MCTNKLMSWVSGQAFFFVGTVRLTKWMRTLECLQFVQAFFNRRDQWEGGQIDFPSRRVRCRSNHTSDQTSTTVVHETIEGPGSNLPWKDHHPHCSIRRTLPMPSPPLNTNQGTRMLIRRVPYRSDRLECSDVPILISSRGQHVWGHWHFVRAKPTDRTGDQGMVEVLPEYQKQWSRWSDESDIDGAALWVAVEEQMGVFRPGIRWLEAKRRNERTNQSRWTNTDCMSFLPSIRSTCRRWISSLHFIRSATEYWPGLRPWYWSFGTHQWTRKEWDKKEVFWQSITHGFSFEQVHGLDLVGNLLQIQRYTATDKSMKKESSRVDSPIRTRYEDELR